MAQSSLSKSIDINGSVNFRALPSVKNAAILFSLNDLGKLDLNEILPILKQIAPNAKFTAFCFCANTKQAQQYSELQQIEVLTTKTCGFNYKPQKQLEQGSVVFDFRSDFDFPTQFLLQSEAVVFRAGLRSNWNEKYLNLMIKVDQELSFQFLAKQVLHYFLMINKPKNAA
jgi:hypothetical protein